MAKATGSAWGATRCTLQAPAWKAQPASGELKRVGRLVDDPLSCLGLPRCKRRGGRRAGQARPTGDGQDDIMTTLRGKRPPSAVQVRVRRWKYCMCAERLVQAAHERETAELYWTERMSLGAPMFDTRHSAATVWDMCDGSLHLDSPWRPGLANQACAVLPPPRRRRRLSQHSLPHTNHLVITAQTRLKAKPALLFLLHLPSQTNSPTPSRPCCSLAPQIGRRSAQARLQPIAELAFHTTLHTTELGYRQVIYILLASAAALVHLIISPSTKP